MADANGPTRVLLATDADWIFDEVDAALASDDTEVYRVRRGSDVLPAVIELDADLVILDLQIGSMGGMATCMQIRNEEGADRLPITAVMMLLDRGADVFLAKRADADGWVFKPLDAFRLRRAAATLVDGYSWYEGVDERTNLPTGLPAEFDAGEEHVDSGADEAPAGEAVPNQAAAS